MRNDEGESAEVWGGGRKRGRLEGGGDGEEEEDDDGEDGRLFKRSINDMMTRICSGVLGV